MENPNSATDRRSTYTTQEQQLYTAAHAVLTSVESNGNTPPVAQDVLSTLILTSYPPSENLRVSGRLRGTMALRIPELVVTHQLGDAIRQLLPTQTRTTLGLSLQSDSPNHPNLPQITQDLVRLADIAADGNLNADGRRAIAQNYLKLLILSESKGSETDQSQSIQTLQRYAINLIYLHHLGPELQKLITAKPEPSYSQGSKIPRMIRAVYSADHDLKKERKQWYRTSKVLLALMTLGYIGYQYAPSVLSMISTDDPGKPATETPLYVPDTPLPPTQLPPQQPSPIASSTPTTPPPETPLPTSTPEPTQKPSHTASPTEKPTEIPPSPTASATSSSTPTTAEIAPPTAQSTPTSPNTPPQRPTETPSDTPVSTATATAIEKPPSPTASSTSSATATKEPTEIPPSPTAQSTPTSQISPNTPTPPPTPTSTQTASPTTPPTEVALVPPVFESFNHPLLITPDELTTIRTLDHSDFPINTQWQDTMIQKARDAGVTNIDWLTTLPLVTNPDITHQLNDNGLPATIGFTQSPETGTLHVGSIMVADGATLTESDITMLSAQALVSEQLLQWFNNPRYRTWFTQVLGIQNPQQLLDTLTATSGGMPTTHLGAFVLLMQTELAGKSGMDTTSLSWQWEYNEQGKIPKLGSGQTANMFTILAFIINHNTNPPWRIQERDMLEVLFGNGPLLPDIPIDFTQAIGVHDDNGHGIDPIDYTTLTSVPGFEPPSQIPLTENERNALESSLPTRDTMWHQLITDDPSLTPDQRNKIFTDEFGKGTFPELIQAGIRLTYQYIFQDPQTKSKYQELFENQPEDELRELGDYITWELTAFMNVTGTGLTKNQAIMLGDYFLSAYYKIDRQGKTVNDLSTKEQIAWKLMLEEDVSYEEALSLLWDPTATAGIRAHNLNKKIKPDKPIINLSNARTQFGKNRFERNRSTNKFPASARPHNQRTAPQRRGR